jgi:hypothetical protein
MPRVFATTSLKLVHLWTKKNAAKGAQKETFEHGVLVLKLRLEIACPWVHHKSHGLCPSRKTTKNVEENCHEMLLVTDSDQTKKRRNRED